jgi:sugar lactone lactonase YvrE
MTLASWFSSMRRTQSRLTRSGARRNHSRAFHCKASFDALEDRRLLSTVNFANDGETVEESAGKFSIPLTLSNDVSTVGFDWPGPVGLAVDSAGNLYVNQSNDAGTVSKVTPQGNISTFAKGFQPLDDVAGDLAFGPNGNLYVANTGANAVNEVTPKGVISTFVSGLNDPVGLAFDSYGDLYVSQPNDNTVSEVTPQGNISTFATDRVLNHPMGLAFGPDGFLYVADEFSGAVLQLQAGGNIDEYGSINIGGSFDPDALAFDSAGNLYVAYAETGNVDEITPDGVSRTVASGFTDPDGLAFDSAGNLYVAEYGGSGTIGTVSKFRAPVSVPFTFTGTALRGVAFSTVTPSPLTFGIGQTTQNITGTLLPDPGADQTMIFRLGTPTGGASLGNPQVNTLTINEPAVVQFNTSGESVSQGAGTFSIPVTLTGTLDGAGTVTVPFTLGGTAAAGVAFSGVTANALTFGPGQTTADITGTLLSDPGSAQTLIFILGTPTGGAALASPTVNTLVIDEPAAAQFSTGSETVNAGAGTFNIPVTIAGTPDGTPAVSPFATGITAAYGVAVDPAGNLYVSEAGNVGVVSPAGKVNPVFSGLSDSGALAFDAAGNLYYIDGGSNTVKKVTPAGTVSTFASGFSEPDGLAFDAAGNLYVADGFGTVSKVTPSGVQSTFASGLDGPVGLAFDPAGNLYVVDNAGNTVSKVTPSGAVSNFASGFDVPIGVAIDSAGNLYVTNQDGDTVSLVTPAGVVSTFATGFSEPLGLALDDGSLYVADHSSNTLSQVTDTITVPYKLGGTAASGVAYSGVTAGVLAFGIGQTTQDITGRLLSDPGPVQTLTITLGAPTGGAALGGPSVNTLTITETTTGGPPPPPSTGFGVPPGFIGEKRVFSHKGKHKTLVGFEFLFSGALDAGSAQSTGHYHVTRKQGKKVKVLRVKSAFYDPTNFSVTISVAGFNTAKATQATITGLEGADGAAIPEFESRL